jgi:apolipoprotein N-acyltransferase
MNFPFLDLQLAKMNVSLLLQPSATWGPVGPLHTFTNRLRAMDHGFTMFRCSSNGFSGVYDPWHKVIAEKATLGRGDFMYASIPIRQKQITLFSLVGFDYLPIVAMLVILYKFIN